MPGNLHRINGVWEKSSEGSHYLKLINLVVRGLYYFPEAFQGFNGTLIYEK